MGVTLLTSADSGSGLVTAYDSAWPGVEGWGAVGYAPALHPHQPRRKGLTVRTAAADAGGDFLHTVSHELRTPLTLAMGYLDLLADELEPGETTARHYLAMAAEGLSRLRERVTEVSAAGDMPAELHTAPILVPHLITQSLTRLAARAESRKITFVRSSADPVRVWGDAERLGQALDQIVGNAIKFSPDGSCVQVSHDVNRDHVAIVVSDEGPGIPRVERSRVFEPFYRARWARDAGIQGLGLGLTIARNIAAMHGGTISIESGRHSGARVCIRIPRGPRSR